MNWRVGLGLALAATAVLCGWSAWRHRDVRPAVASDEIRPDYVMHDFELVALDKQGKESLTLRAPLLERNAADQTMTITTPLFLLPDADGRYWQMRAKTGWVSPKGEELRLKGDVVGTSPEGVGTPTTLETPHLNIFPDKNLARTDAKVVVTQPGSILTGVGFETNTKTRHYVFKSQVKSRYAPKSAR
ncbi:MAG: LPS export ABC transporter periplasmic protein LptC [Pseudoxanthomonas sp.]